MDFPRTRTLPPPPDRDLAAVAIATLALSVVDAACTAAWVSKGWATEANPLMAPLLMHWPTFLMVKVTLTALGLSLLWVNRDRASAVLGIAVCFGVYAWVLGLHLGFIVNGGVGW